MSHQFLYFVCQMWDLITDRARGHIWMGWRKPGQQVIWARQIPELFELHEPQTPTCGQFNRSCVGGAAFTTLRDQISGDCEQEEQDWPVQPRMTWEKTWSTEWFIKLYFWKHTCTVFIETLLVWYLWAASLFHSCSEKVGRNLHTASVECWYLPAVSLYCGVFHTQQVPAGSLSSQVELFHLPTAFLLSPHSIYFIQILSQLHLFWYFWCFFLSLFVLNLWPEHTVFSCTLPNHWKIRRKSQKKTTKKKQLTPTLKMKISLMWVKL